MKTILVGIAGGTGAGKSTLCMTLIDRHPDKFGLIQLDDYFKPAKLAPRIANHINWDHPDALFFDKFVQDLHDLKSGKPVLVNTKNPRLNPHYEVTDRRIPVIFQPKQVMLVEGYLTLFDERVRKLLTTSIWLEADHKTRWSRRVHFKYPEYERTVLLPMYQQFTEPTKHYANHIVDVSDLPKEEVVMRVEEIISNFSRF